MINFILNGTSVSLDVPPEMPLLWALREQAGLTGTKFGCGIGACGACTVHLDGTAVRSCSVPVGSVVGRAVTTIEGLAASGELHPVQQAWIEDQVPQCGYCQSGQIMQASALLARNPNPTDEEIVDAMDGNLCRCATYFKIVDAVQKAAKIAKKERENV